MPAKKKIFFIFGLYRFQEDDTQWIENCAMGYNPTCDMRPIAGWATSGWMIETLRDFLFTAVRVAGVVAISATDGPVAKSDLHPDKVDRVRSRQTYGWPWRVF